MVINEKVLVDTGPLIALFNANERQHEACSKLADNLPVGKAYTCWPVLTEAAYLLRKHPKQQRELLEVVDDGFYNAPARTRRH